jgi:hypothetical protein
LGQEYGERTLSPTALVHESYLKLGGAALAATSTPTWWAFWVVWKRVDSLTSACMRLP